MKRDFKLQTSDSRLVAVVIYVCLGALAAGAVTANPYEAIVGRNVFGLKPPTINTAPPPPPAAAATTIKLQGISTILDRRQVMLRVNTAARPPEPAKEQSYLMIEGQREGEIEVLEIDATTGTVKIKNNDTSLSLNMKDDAVKPAAGPALPGPAVPPPSSPQIPGQPAPANPGQAALGGGTSVTPIGGSGGSRTIPTRSLRTGTLGSPGGGGGVGGPSGAANGSFPTLPGLGNPQSPSQSAYQPPTSNLTADEQMAVIAAQQAAAQGSPAEGLYPILPAKYRIQK